MNDAIPLTSVIVLGYNGKDFIEACFQSLLAQDYPKDSYEMIWVDNHSSDDSVAYIRKNFPQIRVLELDANYGFAEGNNLAVKHAQGDYLVFLNQDTIVHTHWLTALVEAIENNPEYGACESVMLMPWVDEFSPIDLINYPEHLYYTDLSRLGFVEYRTEKPGNSGDVKQTSFITGASFIIRKAILNDIGSLFDSRLNTYSEDLELSLRLNRLGYRTGLACHSVVYHLQQTSFENLSGSLRKAYLSNRNRFIAYYMNLSASAFFAFLPILLIGAPFKAKEFRWNKLKALFFGLFLIPVSLIGFAGAILMIFQQRIARSNLPE